MLPRVPTGARLSFAAGFAEVPVLFSWSLPGIGRRSSTVAGLGHETSGSFVLSDGGTPLSIGMSCNVSGGSLVSKSGL